MHFETHTTDMSMLSQAANRTNEPLQMQVSLPGQACHTVPHGTRTHARALAQPQTQSRTHAHSCDARAGGELQLRERQVLDGHLYDQFQVQRAGGRRWRLQLRLVMQRRVRIMRVRPPASWCADVSRRPVVRS